MTDIDDVDAEILDSLQRNGRLSNAKLAKQVSLSEPSCWRRVKRLEEEGFIEGYQAVRHRLLALDRSDPPRELAKRDGVRARIARPHSWSANL